MSLIFALIALSALVPGPAAAAGVPHPVLSTLSDFYPQEVVITEGDRLVFANLNVPGEQDAHDLTDAQVPARFGSALIEPGQVSDVEGASALPPGRYPFVCTVHAITMRGTLTVDPLPI